MSTWLDGEPLAGGVDPADRGLAYGDGLFETMALCDGQLRHEQAHHARLALGCRRLGLPEPDETTWRKMLQPALGDAGAGRWVIKLILTRGSGGRGYRPPGDPCPRWLVRRLPWPDYPPAWQEQGIALRYCHTRLGLNPALAGIKHLNRLEQVLARSEWSGPEVEGLMLDLQGRVVCATQSNLFWVRDGRLHTPPIDNCGIAGITRARIMRLMPVTVTECRPETLRDADEVAVSNSLMGLVPACRLDGQRWPVGPVVRAAQAALKRD
ncbi:MAG: aminodeoxychorismate lyase [Halothiobacillaceae bacterium]